MVKENHTEQWKKRRGCSRMKGEAGSGFPFGIMRLMVGVPQLPLTTCKNDKSSYVYTSTFFLPY